MVVAIKMRPKNEWSTCDVPETRENARKRKSKRKNEEK